jgi:hypothetical protein
VSRRRRDGGWCRCNEAGAVSERTAGLGYEIEGQCWDSFLVQDDYPLGHHTSSIEQLSGLRKGHQVGPSTRERFSVRGKQYSRMFFNVPSAFTAFVDDSIGSPLAPGSAGAIFQELTTETWDQQDNRFPLPWTRVLYANTFNRVPLVCIWCDYWLYATGTRSSHLMRDPHAADGRQVGLRFAVDGLQHFLTEDATLSAVATARLNTSVFSLVFREWRRAVQLDTGVAGLQLSTTEALRLPNEWLLNTTCNRFVAYIGPTGFDPCQGVNCGPHGRCEHGACICDRVPTHFGEYCEIPPAAPVISASAFYDGSSDIVVLVNVSGEAVYRWSRNHYDRAFRTPIQESAVMVPPGSAVIPLSDNLWPWDNPASRTVNEASDVWMLSVRPAEVVTPLETISIYLPHDGLTFSTRSNTVTVRYRPSLRLSCSLVSVVRSNRAIDRVVPFDGLLARSAADTSNCQYDGIAPTMLLIESSGTVLASEIRAAIQQNRLFEARVGAAPYVVAHEAGIIVSARVTEQMTGRLFVVAVSLKTSRPDIVGAELRLRVRRNALNRGSSLESNGLLLTFRPRVVELGNPTGKPFEVGGVVYFLGSNAGRATWVNPASAAHCTSNRTGSALPRFGCLTPARSSKGLLIDEDSCIASRQRQVCYTDAIPRSWWSFSLPASLELVPKSYSIRNGEDQFFELLRNWEFHGSRDGGRTWTVLSKHENDTTLEQSLSGEALFPIPQVPDAKAMTSFRVLQTSVNSGGTHYLNLAGVEVYGALMLRGDPCGELNCGEPLNGTCEYVTHENESLHPYALPFGTAGAVPLGSSAAAPAFLARGGGICRCRGGHCGLSCDIPAYMRRTSFSIPPDAVSEADLELLSNGDWPLVFRSEEDVMENQQDTLGRAITRQYVSEFIGDGFATLMGIVNVTDWGHRPLSHAAAQSYVLHRDPGLSTVIGRGLLGAIQGNRLANFGPETQQVPFRVEPFWEPIGAPPFVNNSLGPSCLISPVPGSCASPDAPLAAAWGIDLFDVRLRVTGYAIRDGSRPPFETFLRSWNLEGWNERTREWELVDQRVNEVKIQFFQQVVAFRAANPTRRAFGKFRIRITGPNAGDPGSQGIHTVWLSALELYGDVYDKHDPCSVRDCGPHGACAGKSMLLTICVCENGWFGDSCDQSIGTPPSPPGFFSDASAVIAVSVVLVLLVAGASYWFLRNATWSILDWDPHEWDGITPEEKAELVELERQDDKQRMEGLVEIPGNDSCSERARRIRARWIGLKQWVSTWYWCSWCPCWEPTNVRGKSVKEKRLEWARWRKLRRDKRVLSSKKTQPVPLLVPVPEATAQPKASQAVSETQTEGNEKAIASEGNELVASSQEEPPCSSPVETVAAAEAEAGDGEDDEQLDEQRGDKESVSSSESSEPAFDTTAIRDDITEDEESVAPQRGVDTVLIQDTIDIVKRRMRLPDPVQQEQAKRQQLTETVHRQSERARKPLDDRSSPFRPQAAHRQVAEAMIGASTSPHMSPGEFRDAMARKRLSVIMQGSGMLS